MLVISLPTGPPQTARADFRVYLPEIVTLFSFAICISEAGISADVYNIAQFHANLPVDEWPYSEITAYRY
ncbi:MAG: hypothetical protein PVG38_17195, partial [Gammaproteobacteria bacterium]